MGDRYLLKPYCSDCGISLNDEQENFPLMIAVGESLNLQCHKCKTVWCFWVDIKNFQAKVKDCEKVND